MNKKEWIEIPLRKYSLTYKAIQPLTTTLEYKDNLELAFPTGKPALKITRMTKYPMYYRHKSVDFRP